MPPTPPAAAAPRPPKPCLQAPGMWRGRPRGSLPAQPQRVHGLRAREAAAAHGSSREPMHVCPYRAFKGTKPSRGGLKSGPCFIVLSSPRGPRIRTKPWSSERQLCSLLICPSPYAGTRLPELGDKRTSMFYTGWGNGLRKVGFHPSCAREPALPWKPSLAPEQHSLR